MTAPITVVVPTYNRAALVRETVASILAQEVRADQVIVVDDGSTDETPRVLAEFGDAIEVLRKENGGVIRARAAGVARARNDWVAFSDSDDLWDAGHIGRADALRRAEPAAELIFANFRKFGAQGPVGEEKFATAPPGYWDAVTARRVDAGWLMNADFVGRVLRFTPIFPSALLARRALIERAGGFDPVMTGNRSEDFDVIFRCLLVGGVAAAQPVVTVRIREFEGNSSIDRARGLSDEANLLAHLRATRPDAARYFATLDDEIAGRRIAAAGKAFAMADHALLRTIVSAIPPARVPPLLRVKAAIAQLPDAVGLPANRMLQRLRG